MESARWEQIETIFHAALQHHTDRDAYLTRVCGKDRELREEVETLIASFELTGEFLDRPQLSAGLKIYANQDARSLAGESIGPYFLQKLIGRGGMGDVYLARDARLGRLVAMKILPPSVSTSREWMLRFEREARAASSISHPNVAHIYEFGQVGDSSYLAMEYVEGQTLREMLKDRALDPHRALDIAIQVGQALQAAHEAGVVHRDIKPDNIMLRRDGYVKVLDFGLAKLSNSSGWDKEPGETEDRSGSSLDTKAGVVMGTPSYMSPEQVRGHPVDYRTDLWSLGVTLYEMLTRRRPFEGATTSDTSARILMGEPEIPSLDNVSGPARAWLIEIFTKALRKDVSHRYSSAGEIVSDLKRINLSLPANDQSSTARNSDAISSKHTTVMRALQRTSKSLQLNAGRSWWLRQNRLRKGVAISTLAVLLTLGIGFSVNYVTQRRTGFRPDPKSLVYVFYYEYEDSPNPGRRQFYRSPDGFWVERESKGHENVFRTIGEASTHETSGLLIRNILTNLELVIPSKEGSSRKLFFRIPPGQRWRYLGEVVYESDLPKPTPPAAP